MRYLSNKELQVGTQFIFLSMAIVVLEQDIQHIKKGKFKFKELYLNMLKRMISEALNERKLIRTQMKRKDMQVTMVEKNDLFSSFLFLCQGREEKRNYFNPAIRQKVKVIIEKLFKLVQKDLLMKDLQPDSPNTSPPSED